MFTSTKTGSLVWSGPHTFNWSRNHAVVFVGGGGLGLLAARARTRAPHLAFEDRVLALALDASACKERNAELPLAVLQSLARDRGHRPGVGVGSWLGRAARQRVGAEQGDLGPPAEPVEEASVPKFELRLGGLRVDISQSCGLKVPRQAMLGGPDLCLAAVNQAAVQVNLGAHQDEDGILSHAVHEAQEAVATVFELSKAFARSQV
mmetsp:Transcript_3665/g.11358  ORF Transcript_3665/g.11358 Transcript_3665/m.11358 type:complete len:206 (-) Transcript_3665:86-703(-)